MMSQACYLVDRRYQSNNRSIFRRLLRCDGYGIVFVEEVYCSAIEISSSQDSLCEGGSLELTASAGFESYLWSTGTAAPLVTITETGVYTVEAADMNGCLAYGEIEVAAFNISIQPERVAIGPGESLELEVTGQHTDYEWTNGTSMSTLMINQTGAYGVTVTNQAGCVMSSTIEVLDRCDNRIYFGGNYYANGDALVFNTGNTEFGIVFLETAGLYDGWDDSSYSWEIEGKYYVGRRIALRLIDFFQGPNDVTPSPITLTYSHCNTSITVNTSIGQVDVTKYYLPQNKTIYVDINMSTSSKFFLDKDAIMSLINNGILPANGIDWIDFSYEHNGSSKISDCNMFISPNSSEHANYLGNAPRYKTIHINTITYSRDYNGILTKKEWAYIITHEVLHHILLSVGYLCFGDAAYLQPRYYYPEYGYHIDHEDINVASFQGGLNLNTEGHIVNMGPPWSNNKYLTVKKIYPVQLYYVNRSLSYFYLNDEALLGYLTIKNGNLYFPNYLRWKELHHRMNRINENELPYSIPDGNVIRSSMNQFDFLLHNHFNLD